MPVAPLGVADVERWHARLRLAKVGETAIKSRHGVLRAALAQAVRWEWIPTTPRRRPGCGSRRGPPKEAMTIEDVWTVIRLARELDPAPGLAARLAAVGGLRRSELAALRWDDLDGDRLNVDKSVEVERTDHRGHPEVRLALTKTANRRVVGLDAETSPRSRLNGRSGKGVAVHVLTQRAPAEP